MKDLSFLHLSLLAFLFLHAYYKRFSQLFIEESTFLISLCTKHPTSKTQNTSSAKILRDTIRICLPFRMFKTVFFKLHEHSHTGIKITSNTFSQYYFIPYLDKWFSTLIHECIVCQLSKHFNMKIHTAPTQFFSEHGPSFNYRISMDTKRSINPPSHNKPYIHDIIDAFSHFFVTVPIKAVETPLHHWIIKFDPPIYLVTDRGCVLLYIFDWILSFFLHFLCFRNIHSSSSSFHSLSEHLYFSFFVFHRTLSSWPPTLKYKI